MKLKIGDLARRAGLTVRTLHHYDRIGLLHASVRTDAGYRLYGRDDIARLHQIQALRRFGLTLADIGTYLASPDSRLSTILDQQITALARQIAQAGTLREQLVLLKHQVDAGAEPDLASWLTTLELMTMYDTYFTQDELKHLPLLRGDQAVTAEWDTMVARLHALMAAGVAPTEAEPQRLAQQWMTMLERDTGGNPDFVVRLMAMQAHEPAMRAKNGITPALEAYFKKSFASWRIGLFQPYLSASEFAYLQANYHSRAEEWPLLIAQVRKEFEAGTAPGSPAVRQLARQWMEITRSYAGDDPATHERLRMAYQKEPRLMLGSWISEDMKSYVGAMMAALRAG